MPILFAPLNKEMKIKKVAGTDATVRHLHELGIVEGAPITVLSAGGGGVVLAVKEGRLCLDSTVARRILVA